MADVDIIRERLDLDHIRRAAAFAAQELHSGYAAGVDLTPGDATRYQIVVSRPLVWTADGLHRPKNYAVSVICGGSAAYPWSGAPVDASYAASKWTQEGHIWTGVVVAEFLNALADAIAGELAAAGAGPEADPF